MCEANKVKEIERENNYKRFFKDYSNDLDKRMNNHIEHVL